MERIADNFYLAASDLSNHLACHHLTQLNRLVALGEISKPKWYDPSLDVLIKRGQEHEKAYVGFLRNKGLQVADLTSHKSSDATIDAMQNGADVIVQARLDHSNWLGYADILIKVEGESRFGNWSYEVQDTKLAQNTKAGTILQLCLYSDLLSITQEKVPEKMYVVKPGEDFPKEEYRYADYQAYYQLVKRNFENIMAGPSRVTYPEPAEHCNICRWWQVCDKKRHDDDHLSLVAGLLSMHVVELQDQKIQTLEQFARAPKIEKPKRGNYETFIRKQAQAKVQLKGREQNAMLYELLPFEGGRGLNRLPQPNDGDIYFDIEGDMFYEDGGLEYVLGYAYKENGSLVYKRHWSTNRAEEKKAFREFMQFVMTRWKQFPRLHIYHFAPYEPSAIKRLARVHAIFEKEIDDLLRERKFIDLHAVFKEALLASVETYSLKDLEKFTRYTRKVELHDASSARKSVEVALDLHDFQSLPKETIQTVEDYNEDDCRATEALHAWMESLRDDLIKKGYAFDRPSTEQNEIGEKLKDQEARSQRLFTDLVNELPEDRTTWSDEHKAKWLLAHQMDYFRREDKSAWWEYFRVHEMEHEDLFDERKAIVGLELMEELPLKPRERTPVHRYRFPQQEVALSEGDQLRIVKGADEPFGTVESISLENNTIDIKKTGKTNKNHPVAVHAYERVDPGSLWTSIMNLANAIIEDGLERNFSHHASKDMLMKRRPDLQGFENLAGLEILEGLDTVAQAVEIALLLNNSILPIQGPPGSGKTYTGARMIVELIRAKKKVGVTAVSHKVIATLFTKVKELADNENFNISFVHKINDPLDYLPEWVEQEKKKEKVIEAAQAGSVVGGTAWLWSDDMARNTLDYLFIDEAGQMSLSHALAASGAAKNIILLGDPQQLEQPQRGAHPEGSDVAALTHLLDGALTMPKSKGLFLDITRRLHPAICDFTSEIFYEGRLKSLPGLENRVIAGNTSFDGAGLFYVPVAHKGNQSKSPEETGAIDNIVEELLTKGKWSDEKGNIQPLTKDDILIVAPYNAQVAALLEKLPGMRIGTVDKFQGQEAPVVIYSMTSSSPDDAPRGMSFLYNPNRLNVATSRAKCACILVASPHLLEPECRTIEQMKWANALCRFREMAKEVELLESFKLSKS